MSYAAEAPWTPTPSIGALPTGNDDPMAKLNHAVTVHLAELDPQQCAIGVKYDAFRNLLVTAQATFDVTAIKQGVRSASGCIPPHLQSSLPRPNRRSKQNTMIFQLSTAHQSWPLPRL
jgi:hypothetical protein